ncbi:hypothetical protein [Streptococcus mutans]|uniref:hypothetical protein n=1 Tax=Streptococcus mutans TaxID=1309 RepID=UPI0002B59474|nr:hypothetical protein [Streptococcus mutans]EMB60909.1 hypothetical protein SMU21_07960 [Streptococcus mutans 1SM1]EMB98824.1 hypothetical protein SMU66_08376 [Streptococcus mutans N34]MCB5062689.1 hypothetical protein [Streptococcus mutans]
MPDELELVMDIEALEIFEVKYPSQDSQLTKDNDTAQEPNSSEKTITTDEPVQLSLFDSLKSMTDFTYTNSS